MVSMLPYVSRFHPSPNRADLSDTRRQGIAGNRENTEIGHHIAEMMGLNLEGESLQYQRNFGEELTFSLSLSLCPRSQSSLSS